MQAKYLPNHQRAHVDWAVFTVKSWWRHQMETFSALLAICAGNSPVSGEFPSQRPVTRSFDVSFDLCLNKRLNKQSWGLWFEALPRPLWRQCNDKLINQIQCSAVITPSNSSQKIPHSSPIRARYGVSFVCSNSDLYFASITAVMCAMSCYIE